MITKATSPGYLYAVTTDSTCLITDVATRYNLCKAVANKQGMFVAIGGSVECSDDNVLLTQASTISGGTRFEVVTTRPEVGETGVIYLVPASNSTTENLYEEWLWVDDKWEQVGSAGINVSNFAQLTTANTFSADNTFNGNLIKKTSTTALADNSVLNRAEMDSRYGLKSTSNTWTNTNTFTNIEASRIKCLHTFSFNNVNMDGKQLKIMTGSGVHILSSDVKILSQDIVIGNDTSTKVSIVGELSIADGALRVLSQDGIKVIHNPSYPAKITIAPSALEAFPLNQDVFGENKYGIRITETSCQLFGIDFNYGDVWSETNDEIKAQGFTPIPGLDSASYLDTVKIRKPAVSIETTGIGSLSFDYATEAYIRTFPNAGGQGIFEFQAGNWTDSDREFIKRGPVDLRKASATTLVPTSVLNMEEGDARWGGGTDDVAVEALVPTNFNPPVSADVLDPGNIGNRGAYGIAIGPNATANIYRDIAIGGWIDTSNGKGDNTILGYGFSLGSGASNVLAIGQGNNTVIESNNTVFIGKTASTSMRGNNSVAIKGTVNGNSVVAINGTAGDLAVAIGVDSLADISAVAVGEGTVAGIGGTALGAYSVAGRNMLALQAGNIPAISMQLYSGTSWEDRNDTGYLRFVTAKLRENIDNPSASNREEIIIHKKPLWDAIQRAKDYNYPAQPFVSLVGDNSEVPPALANAQPNTIYHIVVGALDINLTDMMFDPSIPGIASAELHFEIPNGTTPFVVWPDIMIWPDEADPTVAPTLSGSASGNKLYAIVVRKQITRAGEFLVASIAYSFEY